MKDVRLTAGGRALAVLAAAFAIAAVVATIALSSIYVKQRDLSQARAAGAVATRADVTDVAIKRGEERQRVVSYRFDAGGRTFTGRATLRGRDQRPVVKGGTVDVGFLPSDPEQNWIAGYESDTLPLFAIPVIAMALIATSALMTWSIRRQWTLLAEGRVAQARVVGFKKVRRDKRTAYRVTCEFKTLSGATRTAKYDAGKTPPAIGSTATIVYHRDDPDRHAAYPLSLVRNTVRSRD